jgi:hypothetical protein
MTKQYEEITEADNERIFNDFMGSEKHVLAWMHVNELSDEEKREYLLNLDESES